VVAVEEGRYDEEVDREYQVVSWDFEDNVSVDEKWVVMVVVVDDCETGITCVIMEFVWISDDSVCRDVENTVVLVDVTV
jgi:hypothetical protein